LAARDVTPEATRLVCERLVEGLAERMRAEGMRQTPMAALSRAVCGTITTSAGCTLIVNLPGSVAGAVTSLGRSCRCLATRSTYWRDGRRMSRPIESSCP